VSTSDPEPTAAPRTADPRPSDPRTFGVEEELLVLDGSTDRLAAAGDEVAAATVRRTSAAPEQVTHEFKREQAEIGSAVCRDAGELLADLVRLRQAAAEGAAATGARVAALATSPVPTRPTVTDEPRYQRMNREFGMVARQQLTCGQHVHVSIASPEEGVAVLDRIRADLSTVLALSTNSPFSQGEDSGYASYRTVLWGMWPTAGPTETFGTVEAYDRVRQDLVASGAALDDGMVYFPARLSARFPTLEVRVPDVCLDVRDAVLVAVLTRALVSAAAQRWRDGLDEPMPRVELLRGAAWVAARSGLTGELVEVRTGRREPAATVVHALLERLTPALAETGDLDLARDGIARVLQTGTGAVRQRAVRARTGDLRHVLQDAVERTQRAAPADGTG
jgi:carboxylate-amine ligase